MAGDRRQCFVIGPLGDPLSEVRNHADWLLMGIIKPVFDQHFPNFDVIRSDQIADPGMIDSQIIGRLLDADLVIADLSLLNANAFYEIGIRHMIRKPIIHMFKLGEQIPFDIKPYRAIPFARAHPNELLAAKDNLKASVDAVLSPGYQVENPVTRTRAELKLDAHATPEQRVLIDQIRELRERLTLVEAEQAPRQYTMATAPVSRKPSYKKVKIILDTQNRREMEIQREEILLELKSFPGLFFLDHTVRESANPIIELVIPPLSEPALLSTLKQFKTITSVTVAD